VHSIYTNKMTETPMQNPDSEQELIDKIKGIDLSHNLFRIDLDIDIDNIERIGQDISKIYERSE